MNEYEFIGRIKETIRLYKKNTLTNTKALEGIENTINKFEEERNNGK